MVYPVNRTDGTLLTTLNDFSTDSSSTSLTLMGRGIINYGRIVAENFVKLMENFTSPVPPPKPMLGQLWYHVYDSTSTPPIPVKKLKVYIGGTQGSPAGWITVGGAYVGDTPPQDPEPGDFWFKPAVFDEYGEIVQSPAMHFWRCRGPNRTGCAWQNVNHPTVQETEPVEPTTGLKPAEGTLWWMLPERQLWIYDSELTTSASPRTVRFDGTLVPNGWTLVGPHYQKGTDTRIEQATVNVLSGGTTNILKLFSDNELVAVYSKDHFQAATPAVDLPNFGTYNNSNSTNTTSEVITPPDIRPGLTLNLNAGMKLRGVAENSELLSNIPHNEFLGRGVTGRLLTHPNGTLTVDLGNQDNRWKDFWAGRIIAGTGTVASPDVSTTTNVSALTGLDNTSEGNGDYERGTYQRGIPNLIGLATLANDAVNAGRAQRWAYTRDTSITGDIITVDVNSSGNSTPASNATPFNTPINGHIPSFHQRALLTSGAETKIRGWAEEEARQEVTTLRVEVQNGVVCAKALAGPRNDCAGFHFACDDSGHIEMYGGSPTFNAATKGLNINGASDIVIALRFTPNGEARVRDLATSAVTSDVSGRYVPLYSSSAPTGQHNLGNGTQRWGTIYANTFDGTATRANYADLAERYHSDDSYPVGTVMVFGGVNEVTQSTQYMEQGIVGVLSGQPAYLMNASAGKNDTHPAIGLKGRVPIRVIGSVKKFDVLVASEIPGVAKSLNRPLEGTDVYSIIGRALEDSKSGDGSESLVLAAIGFK